MDNETKWELSWKRPENLPFPKVWSKFEATCKKSGSKYKIRIQDIPPDRFDEAIELNELYIDRCEPVFKYTRVWEDPNSVTGLRTIRRKICEQRISLMAVIDDDVHSKSQMIGTLLLVVKSKNDPPTKQAGKSLKKMFDLFDYITKGFDQFELLQSDRYIFHFGVTVAPKYQGLGVRLELERQSCEIGKACGISGSSIVFTSNYSQPFWKKLGCTFVNEARYDEVKDENGEILFPNIEGVSSAIFVVWKYPQV